MATVRVEACPFPSDVKSLTPGFELLCLLWLKVVWALMGPALRGEAEPMPRGSDETKPTPRGRASQSPCPQVGRARVCAPGLGEPTSAFLGSGEADSTHWGSDNTLKAYE
jgi:hypothetical protein